MIQGVGVDIVEVGRFATWTHNKKKLSRFFHSSEIEYCLSQHNSEACFAARFAAREALAKALGSGINSFALKDVWVAHDQEGKPFLCLPAAVQTLIDGREELRSVHLSLSHEQDYAVAFVVIG